MGALAGLASQVLSAVTSQVGSYFSVSKGVLPPRQYIVPSTAFVLACIGLAMVILGPTVPGAMWNGLLIDVRLLLTALLVIAFVVVTEASRNLAQLVRKLYSGTWPTISWWQQILRNAHLETRLDRRTQAFDLEYARAIFQDVRDQIGAKPRTDGASDSATYIDLPEYPVLRSALQPFHAIVMADLEYARRPKLDGAITSVVDLIGRYSVQPLAPQQPIKSDSVRTLPDPRFLGAGRAVVALPVPVGQLAAYLWPGVVVTLEQARGVCAPDLLILDRPSEAQVIVSVRADDVRNVLAAVKDGAATFVIEPQVDKIEFTVVPIVRQQLKAGQVLGRADVDWQPCANPALSGDRPLTEGDVIGKVYWPAKGDHKSSRRAPVGEVLTKANLVKIACPACLSADREPRQLASFATASGEDAIRASDVVSIRSGARTLASGCFVFEVNGCTCYVAVPKSTEALGDGLTLSASAAIPVAVARLEPNRLMGDAQLCSLNGQRAYELPAGSCLTLAEVRDRYLCGAGWLDAHRPIPSNRLAAAYPADAVDLVLPEESLLGRQIKYVDGQPTYGDLVSIEIKHDGQTCWARQGVFVRSVEARARLVVKVPTSSERDLAAAAWEMPGAVAEVKTTHSDQLAKNELDKLDKQVDRESALPHYNAAMSDHEPSTREFCEHAPKLAELGRNIRASKARLEERMWNTSGEVSMTRMLADYDRMLAKVDAAAEMWQKLITRVSDNIRRGELINLPADPSDVRPTGLGNVLAASAAYPWRVYGIDTSTVLPLLLTVLDGTEPAAARFIAADASLDLLLLSSFWAFVWSGLCLLAGLLSGMLVSSTDRWVFAVMAMIGVGVAWLMREASLAQAYAYGEAGKVLFDLHRRKLLSSLGLLVKDELTVCEEREQYWEPLYELFAFGTDNPGLRFQTSKSPNAQTPAPGGGGDQARRAAMVAGPGSKNGVG